MAMAALSALTPKGLKALLTSLRVAISSLDKSADNGGPKSSPEDDVKRASAAFALVLVSELASRGVGVELPTGPPAEGYGSEWTATLLGCVRDAAGKVPIDDASGASGYPPPMMAALNAASGMAASACASCAEVDWTSGPPPLIPMAGKEGKSVYDAFQEAKKRCEEVHDGRFYALLALAQAANTEGIRRTGLRRHFNAMAYANYLYGASNFAKDQPPIWKRCLDAALENARLESSGGGAEYTRYRNAGTILPLRNMIRIAQAKGNEKRVKELSLLLVVGCVGGAEERIERMEKECGSSSPQGGKDGKEGEKKPKLKDQAFGELIESYFLRRSSVLVELEDFSTTQTLLDSAKESLALCERPAECTVENHEMWLLYHYVQVQIKRLKEEAIIWIDVQRQHRAMLNRRPEGESTGASIGSKKSAKTVGGKKTITAAAPKVQTREEMESETRSRVYVDAWKAWTSGSRELGSLAPVTLRDAVVALSSVSQSAIADADIVRDCHELLRHQAERLVEIALLAQKQSGKKGAKSEVSFGWQLALSFVSPLVVSYLHPNICADDAQNPLSNAALRRLTECCCEAIVSACWMREPFPLKDGGDAVYDFKQATELLSTAHPCLVECHTQRLEEEKLAAEERKKKGSSALSSHDRHSDTEKKEMLLLQCALAASKCRTDLMDAVRKGRDELTEPLTAAARRATVAATNSAKTQSKPDLRASPPLSLSTVNARFGAPYLQFLSAWSGLYGSPWPFCTLGQARTILSSAREAISIGGKAWGRGTSSTIEQLLLDIGEADLEEGLTGGFRDVSEKLYRQCLSTLDEKEKESSALDDRARKTLEVHRLIGLARLSLSGDSSGATAAEKLARDALDRISCVAPDSLGGPRVVLLSVYPWSVPSLDQLSHSYHTCAARQLVAEACIRSSRPEDARAFLEDAVKDLPGNFEAEFALAAFHLQTLLGNPNDESEAKKTRVLLLKCAKMDTSKADPFALLGIWYESQKDTARAKGCYQKALALDPAHPVAGRGLGRLVDVDELKAVCEQAAKQNAPVNGWAWRALGRQRSRGEGDDSAAICYQQALRCRDIQLPESETLGTFYSNPLSSSGETHCEASEIWAELAACYRRLGKYSAALRAYELAYLVSGGSLSPDAICAWAQVDLDLGLYEEAAEKCDAVLSMESPSHIHRMAAYTKGESLLFLARTDLQEGKFGSCLAHLRKGIGKLSALSLKEGSTKGGYYCEVKLLGDLHTSGSSLPSYAFAGARGADGDANREGNVGPLSEEAENQLSFLRKGEQAYTLALELGDDADGNEEDNQYLISAAATDLGTNLLSQARIISSALGEGSGGATKTSLFDLASQSSRIKDLVTRSINAYLRAIDASPHEAPAWCGLGCALVAVDPLQSQHAFSRALQIDPSLADSWSNIGLLYADINTGKCSEILDQLTQIEDTPLMWVGRGFLLEKTSKSWNDQPSAREACLAKAADAYRAALQISQHPAALLGLSLTCRRSDPGVQESNNAVYSALADHTSKSESRLTMAVHQHLTGDDNIGASFVSGLTQIEEGLERLKCGDAESANAIVTDATATLDRATTRSTIEVGSLQTMDTSNEAQCEIDLSSGKKARPKETAELPYGMIDRATNQTTIISLGKGLHAAGSTGVSLDEARNNVHLNPESGEMWLAFAKKLAHGSCDSTALRQAKTAAKKAAKKAYDLLLDRAANASLVSPRRQASHGKSVEYSEKSVVSHLPSASLLSEAMSLVSWLDDAETVESGSASFASTQEAFMLDPSNPVAAASLGLTA
ncbi:hypothetical protein ACHAXT_013112 [Thalassiosira profunda]